MKNKVIEIKIGKSKITHKGYLLRILDKYKASEQVRVEDKEIIEALKEELEEMYKGLDTDKFIVKSESGSEGKEFNKYKIEY